MNKTAKGLPPYSKTGQSTGGNAIKSDHKIARAKGATTGVATARHIVTQPSASSGTIGTGQPLKSSGGYKDQRLTTLGRPVVSTKPNR